MPSLDLSARVTCFVGENGSGKSTLLEGIAAAAALPTVGATEVARDGTLEAQRRLAKALRLTWSKRIHRGFFLRAEDFFGFQRRLAVERQELEQRLLDLDDEYHDRSSYAKGLAAGPARASRSSSSRRTRPSCSRSPARPSTASIVSRSGRSRTRTWITWP